MLYTLLHGLWTAFARFLIGVGTLAVECGLLLLFVLTVSFYFSTLIILTLLRSLIVLLMRLSRRLAEM